MSERSLGVERLYSLGDYKNIKFSDVINGIPEELYMYDDAIKKIRLLQIIDIEIMFRKYLELFKQLNGMDYETAMEYLEDLRVNTIRNIKDVILETEQKDQKGDQ